MIIVRCPKLPKWGLKNAKRPISIENRTSPEESLLKVSFCENCQRHSCKAFISLTIRAENDWCGHPLLPDILGETNSVGAKSPIFDLFSPVEPHVAKKFN